MAVVQQADFDALQVKVRALGQELDEVRSWARQGQGLSAEHGRRHIDGTDYIWGETTANLVFASPNGSIGGPGFRLLVAADMPATYLVTEIPFIIDGGGSAITTGVKGDLVIPFNCTITRATTLADQSGSIVIDIWKDTYANYPPTVADTITASAKPTLSTATKAQDSTLTGWTTTLVAGDTLRYNVDSITTCTRVLVSLKVSRT